MKKLVFIFFVSAFSTACISEATQKKVPKPQQQLSKDELVAVLVDIHVAQTALQQARKDFGDPDSLKNALFSSVFEKHNTTRAVFDSNISYLEQEPKVLLDYYEEAMIQLSKKQSEVVE